MSLLPLTVSLFVLQKVLFHLERRQFARLVKGFLYAFIGLIVFLVGVYGGFMEVAVKSACAWLCWRTRYGWW